MTYNTFMADMTALMEKFGPPRATPKFIRMPERTMRVPVRTHRKKRIAKKWLKRYGTMLVPAPPLFSRGTVLRLGEDVMAYEPTFSKMIEALKFHTSDRFLYGATQVW